MMIEFGNTVNRATINFDHVRKMEIDVSTIVLRDSAGKEIAREYCGTIFKAKKRTEQISSLVARRPRRIIRK